MSGLSERRGLGRGLSALMADVATDPAPGGGDAPRPDALIPVDRIEPNPDQPRRAFKQDALEELAASIREKGIIQPLILRRNPRDPDGYEIVAGERRWRAAQMAQLHEVPAILREFDDTEVLEIAIIENIQRADLNAVEEARGYRQLLDRFGHTQERLAQALGKSRSHITNLLRLLTLPDEVQTLLIDGRLTAGHARALISTDDPAAIARRVVAKSLSVRETERLARGGATPRPTGRRVEAKDADTMRLERELSAELGLGVSIENGAEGGRVVLTYCNLDQFEMICGILSSRDTAA